MNERSATVQVGSKLAVARKRGDRSGFHLALRGTQDAETAKAAIQPPM
jgi:hypothetical protein